MRLGRVVAILGVILAGDGFIGANVAPVDNYDAGMASLVIGIIALIIGLCMLIMGLVLRLHSKRLAR